MTIEPIVNSVASHYHRLCFVAGGSDAARTQLLEAAASQYRWPLINLGVALAEKLHDVPRRHRAASTPEIIAEMVAAGGDVILLNHVEILFTPELAHDPVRLLQSLSRNRTLVVSWPGVCDGTTLNYAQPGHPEHYRQSIPDLVHVNVGPADQVTQAH